MPTRASGRRPPRCPRCRSPSRATTGRRSADLAAAFEHLNAAYESRFGFRYCVFVAGRSRAALLPEFEAALAADRHDEIHRALDAVIDIAADRYATLRAGATEGGS